MATKSAPSSPTTTAFFVQVIISFGAALTAIAFGIWNLPVDGWIRAFLMVACLVLTTSTFTLAKVVRDQQELAAENDRAEQVRVEKMLAEHDTQQPYAA